MKWLEKLSNNFARSLEAESQAYQSGFGAIGDAVDAVSEAELRPVRSALGDSPEEFTKEDVVIPRSSVLGMNMSNPQEEMPNQRIPKELVNAGLDMALAPSNNLFKCSSKNSHLLLTSRRPSQTPSPIIKPLSKTETFASFLGRSSPLT